MICDMANNIDRIAFWLDLRRGLPFAFAAIVFAVGFTIAETNVPVSNEKISGTVIRNFMLPSGTNQTMITYIELDGGRVISVSIPNEVTPPHAGDRILVMRYVRRFFGDSFGLTN